MKTLAIARCRFTLRLCLQLIKHVARHNTLWARRLRSGAWANLADLQQIRPTVASARTFTAHFGVGLLQAYGVIPELIGSGQFVLSNYGG